MNLSRFKIGALLLSSALAVVPFGASAEASFPSRALKIVVPFSAGGPGDILARVVASQLQETLGQSVVVDNRPGANGEPGTEQAARAEPDGYTILQTSTVQTISMVLRPVLRYDLLRDFEPVTYTFEAPLVLLTPSASSVKTVDELISLAAKSPDGLMYGTGGVGTAGHLTSEMFKRSANIQATSVPYKGTGAAVGDLIGGRLDFYFGTVADSIGNVSSGRLNALAVTSRQRDAMLPDVPTMTEAGFSELDPLVSWGFMVPKGTPAAIVDRLHNAIATSIAEPAVQERLRTLGVTSNVGGGEKLKNAIQKDLELWGNTIRQANIKPE